MALLLEPSKKQLESILERIGETESNLEDGVEFLQSWIKSQPTVKYNCDRKLLELFLRGCKHRTNLAKRKLQGFLQARGAIPATTPSAFHERIFENWNTANPNFLAVTKVIEVCPLPRLTREGHRITIHRILPNHKSSDIFMPEIVRYMLMIGELRLRRETVISGDIFVFDGRDIGPMMFYRMAASGALIQEALRVVHESYPQRLHQIHIINSSPLVCAMVSIVRACMKEKMRNRFVFHTSHETLSDYLPSMILPEEYGGCEDSIATMSKKWVQELKRNKDSLGNVSAIASTGRKKHKKKNQNNNNTIQQDCEVTGAFKTLAVD